ncbi:MAG: hypothetical protein R3202_10360 [Candidatus Competibacterales bacterium]|nr:hypothetical protein [Candidatus Competibacterales bacterium]
MIRGLILFLSMCLLTWSTQAEPIRDWSCESPLTEHFDPQRIWGGPLPAALPENWTADPEVATVVGYAANPENPPRAGSRRISAFAAGLQDARTERLLAVYAGLLDESDTLRGFLIEGIRDYVLRAKILRESADNHQRRLDTLAADADQTQRDGYRQARFWDERNLDDALEEAEFLCHRYAYLDKKLRQLTAAIREAL